MAVDAADGGTQQPLLPPLPHSIEPHTPLTAYSPQITSLHSLARRSSSRSQLLAELTGGSGQCGDPLSIVYPLLLHSFARLQHPLAAESSELQSAQQLWAAMRSIVTIRATQRAFAQSAAFQSFLGCLSALCSSTECDSAELLVLGCQLMANTVANNTDTQSIFLHRHLLSSHFLAIVRSCPSQCLSSLLYVLHTVLPSAAEQSVAVDSPGGAALLAEFTLRLSRQRHQQQQQREADEDDDDDADVDSGLLFPSLVHRLFVQHGSLLSLLCDSLQQHHAADCYRAMTFLLSSLVTLSPCALESEAAAECATSNCLSLLSLLLARYPHEASERIEDDEAQYPRLPQTLLVDEWTHSCIILLEHVLSSCLAQSPSSMPPLTLLRRLFAADVWYVLLSLLSSSNTPPPNPSHSLSSPATASPRSPSPSSRPSIPFGFQSDLLRLLSLLSCYPASHPPPYLRLTALSFLAHTAIHPDQPMQREYSVVGIRGLCRWEEARQTLASMEAQAVDGQEEWRRQGVQLTIDQQSHKVRMGRSRDREEGERERSSDATQLEQPQQAVDRGADDADMWSVERMAAVRSAGRRVDWGDTDNDPFGDDDFM